MNSAPMQSVPIHRSMVVIRFLQIFLTLALIVGIATGFVYYSETRNNTLMVCDGETHMVEIAQQTILTHLANISSDLHFLAGLHTLTDALETNNPALSQANLENDLILFAAQKRIYAHVRLFDAKGNELIQVNYNNGTPIRVAAPTATPSVPSNYFADMFYLAPNQVYVSPFDLATEAVHGEPKSLIRFGTPIVNAKGTKIGAVMLSYAGADLIREINRVTTASVGTWLMVNADGYWLKGPTSADEWGFAIADRQTRTIANQYPDVWVQVKNQNQGQILTPAGLFTFITVHPLTDKRMATNDTPTISRDTHGLVAPTYAWTILTLVPPQVFSQRAITTVWSLVPLATIALLLMAVGAFMMARGIVRRRLDQDIRSAQYDFLQKLIDALPTPVYYKDLDGHYRGCNRAYEEFYGITRTNLIGKSPYDIHPREIAEQYIALDRTLLAQPGAQQNEATARHADGTRRDILLNKATYTNTHDQVAGIVGMILDITERKQMENLLDHLAHFNENIVQSIGEGILMDDTEGRVVFANPAAASTLGYTQSELMGMHWNAFIPPDQCERVVQANQERANGKSGRYEVDVLRQDGSRTTVLVSGKPRFENGVYAGTIAVFSDITEHKQVEERLRQLSRAVEQSPATIVITDTHGRIEYANPKFTQLTGYTLEEARGQNPRILKSGETPAEEYQLLWKAISAGGEWRGEFHNKKKNGELFWESAAISAITNEQGRVTHFLAVKEDITARKEIERSLAEERNQLSTILNHLPALIFIKDRQGRYIFSNPEHIHFLGSTQPSDVLGKTAADLFPPDLVERVQADDAQVLQFGRTITDREETSRNPRTGETTIRLTTKMPLRDVAGHVTGLLGFSRDITERKRMEEAMRAAKEYSEKLFAVIPSAVFTVDLDGIITSVNEQTVKTLGYTREELIGKPCRTFALEPCMRGCGLASPQVKKPIFARECTMKRKDGQVRHIIKNVDELRDGNGNVIGGVE